MMDQMFYGWLHSHSHINKSYAVFDYLCFCGAFGFVHTVILEGFLSYVFSNLSYNLIYVQKKLMLTFVVHGGM